LLSLFIEDLMGEGLLRNTQPAVKSAS